MIRIKGMFKSYQARNQEELTKLIATGKKTKKLYLFNKEKVKSMKEFIDKGVRATYKELLDNTNYLFLENVYINPQYSLEYPSIKDDIRLYFGKHIELTKKLKSLRRAVKALKLKISKVTYKVFRDTIETFNQLIVDKMIKGKVFHLGHHLGQILVVRKKRRRPSIDWLASNKAKAKIIASGNKPYNKEKCPEGIKWLINREGDYGYYWHWTKRMCMIKGKSQFKFKPTNAFPDAATNKLHQYINNNPSVKLKYREL